MTVASPQTPPTAPAKKGMGPLGWIAIGCGAILLIGLLGVGACTYYAKKKLGSVMSEFEANPEMAGAKLMVQMNPDLELVSTDDAAGTLTILNKKNGETVTISIADVKEGKFSVTTDEGTSSVDVGDGGVTVTDAQGQTATFGPGASAETPAWVPTYPNGSIEGAYSSDSPDGRTATFVLKTSDSVADVLAFFAERLKAEGLRAETTTYTANNAAGGTVTATSDDQKRQVSVAAGTADGGGTAATVTYIEKQ
jgi:uncharacterized cupin superfamily protein